MEGKKIENQVKTVNIVGRKAKSKKNIYPAHYAQMPPNTVCCSQFK